MRRYGLVDIPDEPSDIGAIPVSSDSIISGGIVTWSGTGLVFNVSACNYYIDGQNYNSPDATLTLATADPTNDRIDVFAVDINGDAIVITGTPSANPQEPQTDPATQIKLTTVIVGAGATVPSGVTNNMIYDENVEAWSKSSNSLTVDYVNTTTPYVGTYCILATTTAASTFKVLTFYKASTYANKGDYDIFSFAIKLSQTLLNTESIKIIFSNTSLFPNIKVAEYAITSNNSLGLSFSNTSGYQLIGIPMNNINFTNNSFNYVQIQFVTSRTGISFRLDRILLQYGINQPTSPTATNSFGNVVSQSGTASATMATDTLTINGSGLATTSVSGKTLTIAVTNPVSGTLNYISKFTGSGATIGNSLVYDNGTSVAIGTTSPVADTLLQVEGKVQSNVSTSSTSSSIYSIVGNTGVTYAGGSTLSSSVVVNAVQGGSSYTFGGNVTIPNSCVTSSVVAVSGISFTSTGTVTQTQAGYVRSIANIFAMWTKGADVSGTVTHMSNLRLVAFYTPYTSTTLTVNNYYGIIIEDANQFAGVSISNKWGIYQEGTNDNNYFAGKVLIGSNTVGTESLKVVGSAIISSTVTLSDLAGTGTRMVVADGSGVLSTQAIPGGGGGDIYTTDGTLTSNRTLTLGGFSLTFNGSRTATGAIARGLYLNNTLVASANSDALVGLDINPTFTLGAFSFVKQIALRVQGHTIGTGGLNVATNLALGFNALERNTTGSNNVAVGYGALGNLTTAASVIAIGVNAGTSITTTGANNGIIIGNAANISTNGIAIGYGCKSLANRTISIGNNAGFVSTSTSVNSIFIGYAAGADVTSGSNNVIIGGADAGRGITTGSNNTIIGCNITGLTSTLSNNIILGDGSGNIRIRAFNTGNVTINSNTDAGYGFDVNSTARIQNKLSVGTPVATSAIMEIVSTTQGFLPPKLTTTQRTAVASPTAGLEIYNTTLNVPSYYNGTAWVDVLSSKLYDGLNIETGFSTGTKIGTDPTQKIGFFNKTPVIQQDTTISVGAFTANSGTNINTNSTIDGYTLTQVVRALRNLGLLA